MIDSLVFEIYWINKTSMASVLTSLVARWSFLTRILTNAFSVSPLPFPSHRFWQNIRRIYQIIKIQDLLKLHSFIKCSKCLDLYLTHTIGESRVKPDRRVKPGTLISRDRCCHLSVARYISSIYTPWSYVTVQLYRRFTHHNPTGSSVCENSMSLPSVVKAWTNLPTRLQFDDYLFITSWKKIKCIFLYRPVEYNSILYIPCNGNVVVTFPVDYQNLINFIQGSSRNVKSRFPSVRSVEQNSNTRFFRSERSLNFRS